MNVTVHIGRDTFIGYRNIRNNLLDVSYYPRDKPLMELNKWE